MRSPLFATGPVDLFLVVKVVKLSCPVRRRPPFLPDID